METLFPREWSAYLDVLLVFFRLLGFLLLVPALSHRAIPATVKIFLSLSLSLAIYPVVRAHLGELPTSLEGLAFAVVRESFLGALMGFAAQVTFEGIALAAHFTGYQMGLGTASLLDPHSESQTSAIAGLYGWIALLLFLMLDMHHALLANFVASFAVTHGFSAEALSGPAIPGYLITLTAKLFILAVQIAAPFTLILLGCQVVFGILARIMPQMNVLVFSLPVTLLAGLGTMYLLSPELTSGMESLLQDASADLMGLLRTL